MQQQLNTPEDLRAIRQAMDEGKNPLVETDVPRWEDQVGISRIVNRRVLEFEVLPTPAQVLGDLPLSEQAQEIVAYSRDEIRACLYGQDDRLLVVVGPCSVHDPKAALDYARRLSALKGELDGELLIVMPEDVADFLQRMKQRFSSRKSNPLPGIGTDPSKEFLFREEFFCVRLF